jgi:hypothetical protein
MPGLGAGVFGCVAGGVIAFAPLPAVVMVIGRAVPVALLAGELGAPGAPPTAAAPA